MATEPQGPGWWMASDGNHYPPEQHPDAQYRARFAGPPPAPPAAVAPPPGPQSPDPRQTIAVPLGQVFGDAAPGAPTPPHDVVAQPVTQAAPEWQSPPVAPPSWDAPPSPGSPPPFPGAGAASPLAGTYAPPPAYGATSFTPAYAGSGGYPIVMTVDRAERIARWRVFAHGFMVIPHLIVLYLLGLVANIVLVLSWLVVVFTGKLPRSFHDFSTMVLRYGNRVIGFALFLTEEYPPFEFTSSAGDPTTYPIRTDAAYVEQHNRLTTFFRIFMVIPHAFALVFVFIGAYFVVLIAWFAVLFTGRLPGGLASYLIGAGRWSTRVGAYYRLLTDEYPPFSMS